MEKCTDCKKEMYLIEVCDNDYNKLCIACARLRYPGEEALMTEEERALSDKQGEEARAEAEEARTPTVQ